MANGGKRAVAVWHRRAGKDLTTVNIIAVEATKRPGLYWHLFPTYNQGRKIAWDGMTGAGRKFIDHFPKEMIAGQPNNTEMKINFKNGAIYQVVGSDNPDRLVGANPVGVILSEYALQDPRAWDYIRPILVENKGFAIFIYTARGRNHGYRMYEMARHNPKWFAEVLTVDNTDVVSKADIEEERVSGMPEEMIEQEFYCSWDAPLVGSYYGQYMKVARKCNRIRQVPHDPLLQVYTAWDLGVGDSTVIIFYQRYINEIRIIDVYSQTGQGFSHYAKIMSEGKRSFYDYAEHYGPHDLAVRELGTGRSRIEVAREFGINFRVARRLPVDDGIEAVRQLMPFIYWHEELEHLIEAASQYRREWDDKKRCFTPQPYHDWTSDYMDALRVLALAIRNHNNTKKTSNLPRMAESEYAEI